MILGIGTDLVNIDRFAGWHKYTDIQLRKIFVAAEVVQYQQFLAQGLSHQATTFLASRFAAKEAFYKALCAAYEELYKTKFAGGLIFVSQRIEIVSQASQVPKITILEALYKEFYKQPLKVYLSLSHEKSHTLAFVVISR